MIKVEKYEFDNTEIEKYQFHHYKSPISINKIVIDKIVVSNKVLFGKKYFRYFIGYKNILKIRPLSIFLPKISTYRKDVDVSKHMSFSDKR